MIRALLISLCLTSLAAAGVSERDLFEPGDGLLTYDDVNGREWLDLTETSQMSLVDVLARVDSGGVWDGFRFASRSDVQALADSIGAPWQESQGLPWPEFVGGEQIVETLGVTADLHSSLLGRLKYSGGYVTDYTVEGNPMHQSLTVLAGVFPSTDLPLLNRPPTAEAFTFHESEIPLTLFDGTTFTAYWLFREATPIPEPSAAWLTIAACLVSLRLRVLA